MDNIEIGDWVKVGEGIITVQVTQVSKIYVWGDTTNGGTCQDVKDKAEGIELTPDMLIKNGFHEETDEEYSCVDYYLCELHLIYDKPAIHAYVGNVYVILKYVHELQHLLRLCGMNEKADTFKLY